jgi:pimeloyl-ACP methyl ester carboxylesterase
VQRGTSRLTLIVVFLVTMLLAVGTPLGAPGRIASSATSDRTESSIERSVAPVSAGRVTGSSRSQSAPTPSDNVSYNSSVDGFHLSYLEWLPAGFSPSTRYPLAVFLHGVGTDNTWVEGGVGGLVDVTPSLVDNASAYGFILIAINTRSSDGFYLNSPCGGPQQQDVLDAITHEEGLREISQVYLIGFSMGSLGSFALAGHHPGLISGIATAGTITDIYETIAYNRLTRSDPTGLYYAECGDYPSPQNTSVDAAWTYLSVLRFHPQNFSGIPLFATGGGEDTRAPNNFAEWDYANVNNTFVNSTCVVASALGEPANCTVPFVDLSAQDPSAYRWLDLYEPDATHSTNQLPGDAVFSFFLNRTAGGYYVSTFPGDVLVPYTPGTPIHLNSGSSNPALPWWTWYAIGGGAVAVVAAAILVTRRRPRPPARAPPRSEPR